VADAAAEDAALAPEAGQEPEPRRYIEEALWTDIYRYNRASSLRSIERQYPGKDGEEQRSEVAAFPRLSGRRAVSRLVRPYSAFSSEFFRDIMALDAVVEFTTDERGRILTETYLDEEGKVLGTITNVWAGERLGSVNWEAEHETRLIEFGYDANGDRASEKNYRNGVLERSVTSEGNRDVEDLYLNGVPVLRAIWEDGRKISEEAIRPGTRHGG
jgi:hypothetical protein